MKLLKTKKLKKHSDIPLFEKGFLPPDDILSLIPVSLMEDFRVFAFEKDEKKYQACCC
jgi:hypothetical protein